MDLTPTLERIAEAVRPRLFEGKVAGYIPALARVDPERFGIAVVDVDGRVAAAGAQYCQTCDNECLSHDPCNAEPG